MKVIIVPTDFSKGARNAADYAVKLAKEIDGRIILFHAYEELDLPYGESTKSQGVSESFESVEKASNSLLQNLLQDLATPELQIEITSHHGNFIDNLMKLIEKTNAEMVVMGSQGNTALEDISFGSNAINVVKNVFCPVLLIPAEVTYKTPKRIAYASQLEESEIPAIKLLLIYANLLKSTIDFLHVNATKELSDKAKEMLKALNQEVEVDKLNIKYIENENVLEGIEEFCSTHMVDLLTVTAGKRTVFQNLFHSSLTKKLTKKLWLPLFVFHRI